MPVKHRPSARAGVAVLLGLVMLAQPGSVRAPDAPTRVRLDPVPVGHRVRAASDWSPEERTLLQLQNKARRARGLAPMRWRRTLGAIARAHSRTMRSAGTIFHSELSERLGAFRWSLAGENVGVGPTMRALYRAFMNSPGHRANIVNGRFNRAGVGVVMDGSTIYVTAVFMG